jgi:hypothetical protein
MKELFCGFYRPSNDDFQRIWKSAIFILDANILLNMYRYPEEARSQLLSVLQGVSHRLWVPHQAALEFQRNRLTIIAEQKKRFSEVRKVLEGSKSGMASELESLQLKKRHSSIQPDDLILALDTQIAEFLSKLELLEANQLGVTDYDPIREKLDQLLAGKIGEPFSQEEIDKIYKEGETRFKNGIPPGYRDIKKETESKSDTFCYGGIVYQRKFGDLVLWKQIIQKALNDSIEAVIFLTDDEKDDWWWIVDAQGKKKIGPRPELIDEIIRETTRKNKYFYMYNSEQFLRYSNQYLNTSVTDESISQVREVAKDIRRVESKRSSLISQFGRIAEQAVFRWLKKRYPDLLIRENDHFFPDYDYVVCDPESGKNLGFEVKVIQNIRNFLVQLKKQPYRRYYQVKESSLEEITFVFVAVNEDMAIVATSVASESASALPSGVNLFIGIVNEDENGLEAIFSPVSEFSGV